MPSPKRGTDPEHHPFEYLVGVTIPRWKGINKQASAASPQEDELRHAINVRPIQDGYISRPGQAKLTASALGSIEGMFEAGDRGAPSPVDLPPPPTPGNLFMSAHNSSGETVLLSYNTTSGVLTGSVWDAVAGTYYRDLFLFLGSNGTLYGASSKVNGSNVQVSVHSIVVSPFSKTLVWDSAVHVDATDSKGRFNPVEDPSTALKFLRGFNYDSLPVTRHVYYDGALDDTYAPDSGNAVPDLIVFNGTVYAAWGGEDQGIAEFARGIRKRTGAGTWSDLSVPGGPFSSQFIPRSGPVTVGGFSPAKYTTVYGGKLWVCGQYSNADCTILSVTTGDVVTNEHTITIPVGLSPLRLETFAGKLVLFYNSTSGFGASYIATYDGSSWVEPVWRGDVSGDEFTVVGFGTLGSTAYAIGRRVSDGQHWLLSATDLSVWTKLIRLDGMTIGSGTIDLVGDKGAAAGGGGNIVGIAA